MSDLAPTWKVISQPTATGQDANGNYVRGRNVTYQLADGTTGSVFVPAANLTEDYVRQAINDDAAKVMAISKLTSGP